MSLLIITARNAGRLNKQQQLTALYQQITHIIVINLEVNLTLEVYHYDNSWNPQQHPVNKCMDQADKGITT